MRLSRCISFPLLTLPMTPIMAQQPSKSATPNVIIILADDIGYGDLSCNESTTISTPNVERLARSGLRFTNAHSAAATSTPSRYALLTGEYAWRRNGTGIADGDVALIISPDRYTLADMMHDAGYSTCVIGKWHLGLGSETGKQDWNKFLRPCANDIGFDYSFIMAATGDRVPCVFIENDHVYNFNPHSPIYVDYKNNFYGEPTGRDNPELLSLLPSHGHDDSIVNGISRIGFMKGGQGALWQDDQIAEQITARAVDYINQNADYPFFLYFATHDVHVPRAPGEQFRGKSGYGVRGDALLEFDWSVGQILDAVEAAHISDHTIIILTSDNGPVVDDGYADGAVEALGEHQPWGNFRGGKYSAFEAGTRVPCIIYWPGIIQPAVSDKLMCQIDWMASLAALTGVELPEQAAPDSQNLLTEWLGKSNLGREAIVTQNANRALAIIKNGWKYIEPSNGIIYNANVDIEMGNSTQPQLYNLLSDPGETTNLANSRPDIAQELAAELESIKDNRTNQPL